MLFPYHYITHDMEIMQVYMDYIFDEVWMKAKDFDEFELDIFNGNLDLQEIMRAFNFLPSSPKWGKYFLEKVKNIFEIFRTLEDTQLQQLAYWYRVNNDIETLCSSEESPVMYKELKYFNDALTCELKALYGVLYHKKILGLADIKNKIGIIDNHYEKFMKENTKEICPFCGIHPMKGIYHTKREAYDHFLPKGQYPFNSINFKNLAPMCNECNSSYKLENNPIFNKNKERRRAFYPYRTQAIDIAISVSLDLDDYEHIEPDEIELSFTSPSQEEVDTWDSLFEIQERYKAKIAGSTGRYWLNQIIDEARLRSESCIECMDVKRILLEDNPYEEMNFLKLPFLVACDDIGLLD